MASRQRLPELEPISPELVLVSSPEVAQRAREELREPPFRDETKLVVRERPPRAVAAPPAAPRKRRRAWIALACVASAAVAAALVYVVRSHGDRARRVDLPAANAPPASPTASKPAAATKAATGTAPERRRHAAKRARPARRVATTPRPKPKRNRARARKPRHAVASSPGFVPARTWTWPESAGARAYDTQFRLDGRLVLRIRTRRPRLVLPHTFRFHAGTYRWIVERVPAAASRRPIVDSRFVLTRRSAARANP